MTIYVSGAIKEYKGVAEIEPSDSAELKPINSALQL